MVKVRLVVGLFLLLGLLVYTSPLSPVRADPDEVRWSGVSIPAQDQAGNWALADGSDITHLALAVSGTLYAGVASLTYTLYRSIEEATSWSYTRATATVVDIAYSSLDADIIYITMIVISISLTTPVPA